MRNVSKVITPICALAFFFNALSGPTTPANASTMATSTRAPSYPWKNEPDHIVQSPDGTIWFTESGIDEIGRIGGDGAVQSFPLPTEGSWPEYITARPDGDVWFTEQTSSKIGRITESGSIREYTLPKEGRLTGIVTAKDGSIWFSDIGGRLGRISSNGDIKEFDIPGSSEVEIPCGSSGPSCEKMKALLTGGRPSIYGIAIGPDGNIWFGEDQFLNRALGRMTLAGVYTRFPLPRDAGAPEALVTGLDGALWFTEKDKPKIAKISARGQVTEYPIPNYDDVRLATGDIDALAAASDGIWFGYAANDVSRISYDGHVTTFTTHSAASGPRGITSSRDGMLWFSEPGLDKIANMTHAGAVTEFTLPPGHKRVSFCAPSPVRLINFPDNNKGKVQPTALTVTADGVVWFVAKATGKIGALDPSDGAIHQYAVLSPDQIDPQDPVSPLSSIVHRNDNSIWFADGNMLGTISKAGKVQEFRVSSDRTEITLHHAGSGTVVEEQVGRPGVVAVDASDALWFIEPDAAFKVDAKGTILKSLELASGQNDDFVNDAAFAADGTLWFAEPFIDVLGRASMDGKVKRYQLPQRSVPAGPAFDDAGNLWFQTYQHVNVVPPQGKATQFMVASTYNDFLSDLLPTKSGTWFTKSSSGVVGEITTNGVCTEYALPHWNSDPWALAQGPDGSIWFTESGIDAIGRVSPDGKLTEFALRPDSLRPAQSMRP